MSYPAGSSPVFSDSPILRARAIRRSLACHILGWCSLVPWLGLPCALLAWWQGSAARLDEAQAWNPARTYRLLGLALAALGATITLISAAIAALSYARTSW